MELMIHICYKTETVLPCSNFCGLRLSGLAPVVPVDLQVIADTLCDRDRKHNLLFITASLQCNTVSLQLISF